MKAATHLFSSFLLGVALCAFWLRDRDYYWVETLGSWQGPYSSVVVRVTDTRHTGTPPLKLPQPHDHLEGPRS